MIRNSIQIRLIFLLIGLFPALAFGQSICSEESRQRLDSALLALSEIDASLKSMNELVQLVGPWYLNTPYVEKTLEVQMDEALVINFTGLDCTTFLESIVTLVRIKKQGRLTFDNYEKELEFLRYRNGIREDYPSRLHYFSDWIYDSEQKGILKDMTKEIGGMIYANTPSFMSNNPGLYPQLCSNTAFVDQIRIAEAEIATRPYYYIPKEVVQNFEDKIQPGDVIAITVSMDNLDISHVGFAVAQNGRIHLLHASSNSKKVEISEKPLNDYLMSHKSQTGIMICRLQNPV